jgi:ribokinase
LAGTSAFLRVPRFHVGGETVHADALHVEYGGKGFNQAVAAARWGAETSFLAAVGAADAGPMGAVLDGEGIAHRLVVKEGASAYAAILTDPSGETRVTVCPGVRLVVADVEAFEDEISAAAILLLTNEVPEAVNVRAVELAARHGTKVVFNPAPARSLPETILRGAWLFTPNAFETAGLEANRNVVETRGGEGCFLRASGRRVPAKPVGEVVDTTGAGDTFNGVLAAELAGGAELERACAAANAAAGQSVTKCYVLPSIPFNPNHGPRKL